MPRTGVFLSSYDELECKEDPISRDHVNEMREAPIVLNGYRKEPFSVDALLRALDAREVNPLSNAPILLNEMQPVLTPDNRAAYKRALVKLASYGWDDASQINADSEAYAQWTRKQRVETRVSKSSFANEMHLAVRQAQGVNFWGRFEIKQQSEDTQAARRALDLDLCENAFRELDPYQGVEEYVDFFLECRFEPWRIVPQKTMPILPIWMSVNELCDDFLALTRIVFPKRVSPCRARIVSMLLNRAPHQNLYIAQHGSDALSIVSDMEPYLLIYLMDDMTEAQRALFCVPRTLEDITERLFSLETEDITERLFSLETGRYGGRFTLELTCTQIEQCVMKYFDLQAQTPPHGGLYYLPRNYRPLPADTIPMYASYEAEETKRILRRGLRAMAQRSGGVSDAERRGPE
jgi:hypothetical protein